MRGELNSTNLFFRFKKKKKLGGGIREFTTPDQQLSPSTDKQKDRQTDRLSDIKSKILLLLYKDKAFKMFVYNQ